MTIDRDEQTDALVIATAKGNEALQIVPWSGARKAITTNAVSQRMELPAGTEVMEIAATEDVYIAFGDNTVIASSTIVSDGSRLFTSGVQAIQVPLDPATGNPYVFIAIIQKSLAGIFQLETGGANVTFSTFVFHALDDVAGTFVADVIIGTGTLTEGRTATIYLPDDSSIWQPFTSGVPGEVFANGKFWLYGAPAATNEFTFSRDLTDVTWIESGTNIAAFDAVGLTGDANTASTLTDDNAGANEFTREQIVIPNDSDTHTIRVWIFKDTDETRFYGLHFNLVLGTSQQVLEHFNSKTGAHATQLSTGTFAIEVNDAGLWWEVLISVVNNTSGNTSAILDLYPAIGTVIGTPSNAATGSIRLGNAELHLNKTIVQVRGTSPIFTSGSTVTVDTTNLSVDDANHNDTEGAYFCEFKNVGLDAANNGGLIGLGPDGRLIFAATVSEFRALDGVTNALGPTITFGADDIEYKVGMAYGSSLMRVNTDDSWGTAVAYDGVFNNLNNEISILERFDFEGPPTTPMLIRNIRRYNLSFVAAQAKIEELMA